MYHPTSHSSRTNQISSMDHSNDQFMNHFQVPDDNQLICALCYKQCDMWECFKIRCQQSYKLQSPVTIIPDTNLGDVPDPLAIKTESANNECLEYKNSTEVREEYLNQPEAPVTPINKSQNPESIIIPDQVRETQPPSVVVKEESIDFDVTDCQMFSSVKEEPQEEVNQSEYDPLEDEEEWTPEASSSSQPIGKLLQMPSTRVRAAYNK